MSPDLVGPTLIEWVPPVHLKKKKNFIFKNCYFFLLKIFFFSSNVISKFYVYEGSVYQADKELEKFLRISRILEPLCMGWQG